MPTNIAIPVNPVLVNYTNALTSASNEIYISPTDSPDSLAFLIKNNTMISFFLIPPEEEKDNKNELNSLVICQQYSI